MTVNDILTILEANCIAGQYGLNKEVLTACGSDMMSDVLAFAHTQCVLLTGLCNPQVIRTAEMMDIVAIIFVRGKTPDDTMKAMADELGLPLLVTPHRMFSSCGKLYEKGLTGGLVDG